jgi:PAS domain S-box-containing protein
MMMGIKGWLAPPVFPDDEIKTRRAYLLNAALINIGTLIPVLLIGNLIGGRTPLTVFVADLLGLASFLVLRAWMQRGKMRLASISLMVISLVLITASVASLGTVRAPATTMFMLVVITGGLLFGLKGMLITTGVCSLLVGGLIGAEKAGLLATPDYTVTITQWIAYTAILGWTGGLTYSALRVIHQALEQAKKEITEAKRVEREIKESEAKFRALVESSMDAILLTSPDGSIQEANPAACEMFGRTESEIVQAGRAGLVDMTDPRSVELLVEREKTGRARGEMTMFRKDGTPFPVDISSSVFQDRNGNLRINVSIRDITERVQAEEALRESIEFWRRAEQIAHLGYWSREVVSEEITWSEETCRIFGFEPHLMKFPLSKLPDHVHTEDRQMVSLAIQDAVAGIRPYDLEYRALRPDGTVRWVHSKGEVSYDEDGQVVRMFGVVLDVTERKQAQQALEESERKFRQVTETIQDVFWISTPGILKMIYISPGYEKIWRKSVKSLYESPGSFLEVIHPEDLEQYLSIVDKYHAKGKSYECEYRILPEAGTVHWIQERGYPVSDDQGKIILMTGVCTDITERKRVEEALRESEERLRLANKATNDVIWDWDIINNTQKWNEAGAIVFGWKEIVERPQNAAWWLERIHIEDRERVEKGFFTVVGDLLNNYWQDEYRFLKTDGSYAQVVDRGYILRDAQGKPVRMIGAMLDITEPKRAENEIRRRAEEMAILNTSARQLLESLDMAQVAETVVLTCVQSFGVSLAWLLQANPDGSMAHIKHFPPEVSYPTQVSIRWDDTPLGRGPTGRAVRSGQAVTFTDLATAPDYVPWRGAAFQQGFVTSGAFPLIIGNKTFGCLNLYSDQPGFFTEERIELHQAFANQAAMALENARLYTSVRTQREELRSLASRLAQVEETERRNIARELHDRVGQNLTALSINLNILRNLVPVEDMENITPFLDDSQTLIERTSRRIRDVMAELRPPELDDYGLAAALRWFSASFAVRNPIEIEAPVGDLDPRPPGEVETGLFRIAQEALTNIAKHAQATRATITLSQEPDKIRMTIADNGIGFDLLSISTYTDRKKWGLLNMRERVEALGGQIRIESTPGQGTWVIVEVAL